MIQLERLVDLAEKVDIASAQFIMDYLNHNHIPYDWDAIIFRDFNTGRWIALQEFLDNPELQKNVTVTTYKECSIRIHFLDKKTHISICKCGDEWLFTIINPDGRKPEIVDSKRVIKKLAHHLSQYLSQNS